MGEPTRDRQDAPPLFHGELAVPEDLPPERIIDGEVVERQPEPIRPRAAVATVRAVVTDVATHPHAKTAARHVVYVGAGAAITVRRAWDGRTSARLKRSIRAAEALGNTELMLQLEDRLAAHRAARHQRMIAIVELPGRAAAAAPKIGWSILGLLSGSGVLIACADQNIRGIAVPFRAAGNILKWIGVTVTVAWGPLILITPWVVVCGTLAVLWQVGRSQSTLPTWVRPAGQEQPAGDDPITPSVVVVALRDLGIPALRKAIKDMGDAGAAMLGPIRIAGCGDEVDVKLPSGVSTLEVQDRRRKLAENLGRHEHELHITIPKEARTVRLWIAHSGALDEPIGPSPLTYDVELVADFYTGHAPWGMDLRGDPAPVSVFQRHVLVTGKSNQGKTASLRALALWLALDPTVEFRIGDLKGVGDWRPFDGLATVLIQGPTDEHVIQVTEMLEEGVAEMERRLVALEQSGATDGITRDMARKPGSGFHPIVLIVDEAQVAFMCPVKSLDGRPYGGSKHTSRYFMAARKIHNQGRAVNVMLWQGTQDPTDQNLPKMVREGAHIRGALYLGTESQSKMALGDAPVDAGAAPHKLRDGLDRGTLVVAGPGVKLPAGQPSVTIRTHFISGEDGAAIAERARERRRPVTTRAAAAVEEEHRDLLADLAKVMDAGEKVRLTDLVSRLRELAPSWRPYERLTATMLRAQLEDREVRVTNTGNVLRLDASDLPI